MEVIKAFTYPITIVWKYTSTSWQVYSSLASLKSSILNNALDQITTLSYSDGIWVFAEIGTSLNYQKSSKSSDYLQSYTNKWNLSGTQDDIETSTLSCSGVAPKSIWKYQNGSWQLNTKVSNTLGLKSFTTINANEGFWVECQ